MPLKIPIQITFNDFKQHFFEHSWYYRRRFLITVFLSGWFVTSVLCLNWGWASLLIFPVVLPIVLFIFVPRRLRRLYQQNTRFQEQMTYFINEEKIRLKGESFELTLSWEKLYRVGETPNFFLLMHNVKLSHIIPKRFLDEKTSQQIREIAKTKSLDN